MIVGTAKVTIFVPLVHSLKEKRMIVKSLCAKMRNKFNVSVAEIDEQDTHDRIVIGFACVTNDVRFADSVIDTVLNFIDGATEGEIIDVDREFR